MHLESTASPSFNFLIAADRVSFVLKSYQTALLCYNHVFEIHLAKSWQ